MIASKRKNQERRRFVKAAGFPLTDRKGCVVLFNRSVRADRRLNNFRVREIPVDELARELGI